MSHRSFAMAKSTKIVSLSLVHVATSGVAGEVVQYRDCAVVDDLLEVLDRGDEAVLEPTGVEGWPHRRR